MATWNSSGSQELSYGSCCHAHLQVKFGSVLDETLFNNSLPCQLVEMVVYIARGGATTTDIFRRPGSTSDVNAIIADLTSGRPVDFAKYNFYTLASVVKKFLLKIPGGLFGPDTEDRLLEVLKLNSRAKKYESINDIITQLSFPTQQLLSLLLGTWFRIVNHSEYNTMSSDAVAKNVAGALFHSVGSDYERLESAVQLLQIMIDDFSVVNMLGAKNVQYFTDASTTCVSAAGKRYSNLHASSTLSFRTSFPPCLFDRPLESHELNWTGPNSPPLPGFLLNSGAAQCSCACLMAETRGVTPAATGADTAATSASLVRSPEAVVQVFPPTPSTPPLPHCSPSSPQQQQQRESGLLMLQKLNPQSSASAPDVNKTLASPCHSLLSSNVRSSSLTRFDGVKRRQLMRMKRRSHWFLSSNSTANYRPELPHETRSLIGMDETKAPDSVTHDLSLTSLNNVILLNNNFCRPDSADALPPDFPKLIVPSREPNTWALEETYPSDKHPSTNGHPNFRPARENLGKTGTMKT